jgi:hypothetical protein
MNASKIAPMVLALLFLGLMSTGTASAQGTEFRSGASIVTSVPVNFNVLAQRAAAIYDVVEGDDKHLIWKFAGPTGDLAFIFADGRVVVGSTAKLSLIDKDTLEEELKIAFDLIKSVSGKISKDEKTSPLDNATYYADNAEYHGVEYDHCQWFIDGKMQCRYGSFTAQLAIPNGQIMEARMQNISNNRGDDFYLDEIELSDWSDGKTNITGKLSPGLHSISIKTGKDRWVTMSVDAITSQLPPEKKFVLHSEDFSLWINETTTSRDLRALQEALNSS